MVVHPNHTAAQAASIAARGRSRLVGSRVKTRELVNITTQLAIMTRAGVDLSSALQSLVRQCKSPVLRDVLADIHESVLGGNSVSEAMSQYHHVFNETYVASISAGEASGRLADVLAQLAGLLRSEMRLKNSLRTMLAYPVLLASVSSAVLLALLVFVLPRFAEIFTDFDATLPAITQLLLAISGELRSRYWLWLPLAAGLSGALWMFRRSGPGQHLWDHLMLHTPLLRDVTRMLLIGRICRLLGVMIDSGVPLLDSLQLARSGVRNTIYRSLFEELEGDVLNGRGLSGGLLASEFVPASASEMIVTGEKTGTLGSVTRMIGEHFEEEGEARLKEIVTILEPAITVVMGVLIAIIVMAVMLPLFDLSTAVKG